MPVKKEMAVPEKDISVQPVEPVPASQLEPIPMDQDEMDRLERDALQIRATISSLLQQLELLDSPSPRCPGTESLEQRLCVLTESLENMEAILAAGQAYKKQDLEGVMVI